jgi:hypothetical protein
MTTIYAIMICLYTATGETFSCQQPPGGSPTFGSAEACKTQLSKLNTPLETEKKPGDQFSQKIICMEKTVPSWQPVR